MLSAWFGAFNGGDHGEMTHFESPENGYGRKDYEWSSFVVMGAVTSLCIVVSITVVFYYVYFRLYSNRLRQAENRPRQRLRISRAPQFSWRGSNHHFSPSPREGLCRAVVDALPIFVYKPENFEDGLSCAVCLCEFQENEKVRLLPSCTHNFHVDCIDMWFSSHSTCPLCRASVEAQSDETLEMGRREMEVSVREEEEAFRSNSSTGSSAQAAERGKNDDECLNLHINGEESSEMEVRIIIREYIAVDIPTTEK